MSKSQVRYIHDPVSSIDRDRNYILTNQTTIFQMYFLERDMLFPDVEGQFQKFIMYYYLTHYLLVYGCNGYSGNFSLLFRCRILRSYYCG